MTAIIILHNYIMTLSAFNQFQTWMAADLIKSLALTSPGFLKISPEIHWILDPTNQRLAFFNSQGVAS